MVSAWVPVTSVTALGNAYGILTHYNELKPLYVQFYEVVTGRGLRID